ncbi:hypothetical protein BTS2_0922 [Bacillus sp. TS-2]|nr:hypothetical protein BTS2_0922 [Bacillus sp. TS-2]
MDYHPNRMRQLISIDPFLFTTYQDIQNHFQQEEAALHVLFKHFVETKPILRNAYQHLTDS